jgi:hypothetical protein
MAGCKQRDWRELCAAVVNETDPDELSALIPELIRALDEGERSWHQPVCWPDSMPANREATMEIYYG